MATHQPTPPQSPSATEIAREMRERNAPRRERVLAGIKRLREIAVAKQHGARR